MTHQRGFKVHILYSEQSFCKSTKILDCEFKLRGAYIYELQKYCELDAHPFYDDKDENIDGKLWNLELYPHDEDGELNCKKIYVNFKLENPKKENVLANISITTFNKKRYAIKTFKTEKPHNFLEEERFEPKFYFKVDWRGLILTWRIEYLDASKYLESCKCDVINDLGRLYESGSYTDMTIAVDGRELKAHKAILAARSEVFAAMFEHEMLEKKSNLVTITDLTHDVVKEMLHFVYTGHSPKIKDMTLELLNAAEKYALERLKRMCTLVLMQDTTLETATEMLALAERYNMDELKKYAIKLDAFKNVGDKETTKKKRTVSSSSSSSSSSKSSPWTSPATTSNFSSDDNDDD